IACTKVLLPAVDLCDSLDEKEAQTMTQKRPSSVPRKLTMPQVPRRPAPNQAEVEIDRAVARVHQLYGPDLSVFFKAVQDQLKLEQRDSHDQERDLHLDYKR